jgi:hypothetical protein
MPQISAFWFTICLARNYVEAPQGSSTQTMNSHPAIEISGNPTEFFADSLPLTVNSALLPNISTAIRFARIYSEAS